MTKKNKILIIVLSILTAIMTAFIWNNSTVSAEGSGNLSKSVTEVVCEILGDSAKENFDLIHYVVRKTAHFTEFCILGTLYMIICTLISGKALSSLVFFPISSVLFSAVIDEYIQSFTGRGSSVKDVMLDFCGAIFGIAVVCLTNTLREIYIKNHKHN